MCNSYHNSAQSCFFLCVKILRLSQLFAPDIMNIRARQMPDTLYSLSDIIIKGTPVRKLGIGLYQLFLTFLFREKDLD